MANMQFEVVVSGVTNLNLMLEALAAKEFNVSSEYIVQIGHAHPTLSEAMHEAARAVDKRPSHF